MQTIYKYLIDPSPCVQEIEMYYGAKVLSVGVDGNDNLAMWVEVNTDFSKETHKFFCVGTGWNLDDIFDHFKSIKFHGTIVEDNGLVWHIYEVAYEY